MSHSASELASRIETLHATLNEMYALDSSWRNAAGWPSDVEGSTLHSGASPEEIAEAEARFGQPFPPSYKRFLRLHRAWEHFWGDFTLIGIGRPETQTAQDEILENTEEQVSDLHRKLGDRFSAAAVSEWEAEEERNLYLPNHLVIGTDFSGAHWVYDTRTRREDGEMKLVHWDISYGAQEPQFDTFDEFVDWATSEAALRLDQVKVALNGEGQADGNQGESDGSFEE